MSIGKRLLNLVKANLNALLDTVARDEAKVEDLSDEELAKELERRLDRKKREEENRRRREAAEQAARERGAQRRETSPPPRSSSAPPPRNPRPARPETERERLARLYATLETPVGADLETIKRNFRRLMRKYHPDVNAASGERARAINEAYAELERRLAKKTL